MNFESKKETQDEKKSVQTAENSQSREEGTDELHLNNNIVTEKNPLQEKSMRTTGRRHPNGVIFILQFVIFPITKKLSKLPLNRKEGNKRANFRSNFLRYTCSEVDIITTTLASFLI
jgi:hypothetical protein